MRERDWRRRQRAKALARARLRVAVSGWRDGAWAPDARWIGRSARTPHPCSGHCCGNPRRHGDGEAAWRVGPDVGDWDD